MQHKTFVERREELKDLKVKLPYRLVVRLHATRVLEGRAVGDTIRNALDAYFREEDEGIAAGVQGDSGT